MAGVQEGGGAAARRVRVADEALLRARRRRRWTPETCRSCSRRLPPSLGGVPTTVVLVSHERVHARGARAGRAAAGPDGDPGRAERRRRVDASSGRRRRKALDRPVRPRGRGARSAAASARTIEANKVDLLASGLAADRIAAKTQLPLQYRRGGAEERTRRSNPGLVAKRLDGRVVLFREGVAVPAAGGRRGVGRGGVQPCR